MRLPPTEAEQTVASGSRARTYLGHKVRELFGIDIRSLAVFRIGLALVVLRDLSIRAEDLECFYADSGALSRRDLLDLYPSDYHLSLHLLSGLWQVQALLFLLAATCGVMLLFGYRTRVATIGSWLLLISIQGRNPLIGHAGDVVLRVLLFWGMFLPLGACYSLDRARDSSGLVPQRQVSSAATLALLLQVAFLYVFSGLLKSHPVWRSEGTAVWYALSLERFSTELGRWLLNYPELLRWLTFATIYLELYGPLVAFIPFWNAWFRMATLVVFVGFHVGLILALGLGIFPFVCIVAWSAFVPGGVWDFLERRLTTSGRRDLAIIHDGRHDLCRRLLAAYQTFFLFGWGKLQPAAVGELAGDEPKASWWMLRDADGKNLTGLGALAELLRLSPLLWPLAWLLTWVPVARGTAWIYTWLAARERGLEACLFFLRPAPFRLWTRLHSLGNSVVLFYLLLIFVWNLRTVDYEFWSMGFPDKYNLVVELPRLDQNWFLFAPSPARDDGWFVLEAQLRDGTFIDLYTGGGPVTDAKPLLISATLANERVQKYMEYLSQDQHHRARFLYLDYRCRIWNQSHENDPGRKVAIVRMYYWEKLNTYGAPLRLRKIFLTDCIPAR